jgi:histone acetyltransferase (RNA polymerase elongator complex component)
MTNDEFTRPLIIPVFIPHAGCPHQCVFCNQRAITGNTSAVPSAEAIVSQIKRFLKFRQPYHTPIQISFYGGNFLGLEDDTLYQLLNIVTPFVKNGEVDSIRFSTRPDTITPHSLDIIKQFPIRTLEIGVQSMDDGVLKRSRRGHTSLDIKTACNALRSFEYEIGMQLMVGLPGDDDTTSMKTAQSIAALQPDFVRIYPTIVLKSSRLEKWYRQGSYQPMSLEAAVSQTKKLYLFFRKHGIPVIRMGLQASEELDGNATVLAGPYHPAFGHLVHSELFYDMCVSLLEKIPVSHGAEALVVHPNSLSKIGGLHNSNIRRLEEMFQREIHIVSGIGIDKDQVALQNHSASVSYEDLMPGW